MKHSTIAVLFLAFSSLSISAQPQIQSNTNHPVRLRAKVPWAVGFSMKGVVTNVVMAEDRIQFRFTGWFSMDQISEEGKNVVIKVDCERGISATVTPDSFVAMTADWGGGSVQNNKGRLFEIFKTAEKKERTLKISLLRPKMDFGKNGFMLHDATVHRITDADLH